MNALATLGCKGKSRRPQMENAKQLFSIAAVSLPVMSLFAWRGRLELPLLINLSLVCFF